MRAGQPPSSGAGLSVRERAAGQEGVVPARSSLILEWQCNWGVCARGTAGCLRAGDRRWETEGGLLGFNPALCARGPPLTPRAPATQGFRVASGQCWPSAGPVVVPTLTGKVS